MARLFISYSHSDRQYLNAFLPMIEAVYGRGSVWFDEHIQGGTQWRQSIFDAVRQCSLCLYLVSNESLESEFCREEIREAVQHGKPLLPVIVRRLRPPYPGGSPPDLAPVLAGTQAIDLIDLSDTVAFAKVIHAINAVLAPRSAGSIPDPAAARIGQAGNGSPIPSIRPRGWMRGVIVLGGIVAVLALAVFGARSLFPSLPGVDITSETPAPTDAPTRSGAALPLDGEPNIFLFPEFYALTIRVFGTADLSDLTFGVETDSGPRYYAVLDGFPALAQSGGIAEPPACYIYVLAGEEPPVSANCAGPVFRMEVSADDRFWYDRFRSRYREVSLYRGAARAPTGMVCDTSQPECRIRWFPAP